MPNLQQESAKASPASGTANAQRLSRLAQVAERLGEASLLADIRQLVTRIEEGRFFVVCIGQFKRGKSTLLDALVGEPVLPSGVVPVTAVPTVLRYGDQKTARVLIDEKWQAIRPEELAQYVSEELNPENKKRVEGVEVFLPAPLLASGMCLVDTPGIGSVFAGNTKTTRDFIPQIDAALLVVGTDPPISGDELTLIQSIAANVDTILVVLNKIDRVSLRERQEAAAFAGKVLASRLQKPVERIYLVSALNRLNNSPEADDWLALVEDIGALAKQSGQAITRSAADRGIRRFSASLARAVDERMRALREPIANSEQRIADLRQTVSQAEQSLRDLGALFSAEQMRLSNTLLARRKDFFRQTLPTAVGALAQQAHSVKTGCGPERRRELMALAQAIARQHLMPWLSTEEAQAEELYRAATQRFVTLVNELLQRISEEQSADFSHLPKWFDSEQGFRTRSRFFFHDMITIAQPASPLLYSLDTLMGALHIHRWFHSDAEGFLEELLNTNASRVQGDVEQRVVESRLQLESGVRRLLREVSDAAEQALLNAREVMSAGNDAVAGELERLNRLRGELSGTGLYSAPTTLDPCASCSPTKSDT